MNHSPSRSTTAVNSFVMSSSASSVPQQASVCRTLRSAARLRRSRRPRQLHLIVGRLVSEVMPYLDLGTVDILQKRNYRRQLGEPHDWLGSPVDREWPPASGHR